ncbi:hypothetical protein [Maritimibacter sp. UBA3975]|uniref:hypothetical protein n=1 Tax=Maritimibacter sp. UBA3975 TaxID=1946833 RepID=UPI000C0A8C38|nr:hypothetical protein [Maritimibacter sp. UBA3975]MAM63832.1 hypothetical protein [Maritimibacter sp.]|tara:strand:+ start:103262 stop:104086 length:825 start_codon:yes stop_codon:yes gene_type:complete
MPRQFLFPLTTGRSGTVFLTELLRLNWSGAEVHHERLGYELLGVESPDASHYTRFNSVGNDAHVRTFWRQKLARLIDSPAQRYAEVSHFLFKAGLVENIAPLTEAGEVHLVILTRDPFKIQWSYVNRFEFANFGFTWLFALDPRYPNTVVQSRPFMEHGVAGNSLWYVHEVFARAEYYALLTADMPNVHIHRVDLSEITRPEGAARLLTALGEPTQAEAVKMPPRQNATKQTMFDDKMKAYCQRLATNTPLQSEAVARKYFDAGRRLATGVRRR